MNIPVCARNWVYNCCSPSMQRWAVSAMSCMLRVMCLVAIRCTRNIVRHAAGVEKERDTRFDKRVDVRLHFVGIITHSTHYCANIIGSPCVFLSDARIPYNAVLINPFLDVFPGVQDGQRGHLEGLASVYCELLMAPFGDVITALESARQAAWAERSPQNRSVGGSSSGASGSASAMAGGGAASASAAATRETASASMSGSGRSGGGGGEGPANFSGGVCMNRGHRGSLQHGGLPNSHSQPIYVPGKYSVSAATTSDHRAQYL